MIALFKQEQKNLATLLCVIKRHDILDSFKIKYNKTADQLNSLEKLFSWSATEVD